LLPELGDEIFFSTGIWPNTKIMRMIKSGDQWLKPDTATFLKKIWATEPAFSPDGNYLYFSSSKGKSDIKDYSLFRTKKLITGWSEPEICFDLGADTIWEFHPTVSKDGSLYFCYWNSKNQSGDIYLTKCMEDKFSEPVKLADPVNSDFSDIDPYVSPEGDYLIFASNRSGGLGGFDHYITFKNDDRSWSELKNPGEKLNTKRDDYDIDVSPDGKYIFEYIDNNIFWLPAGDIFDK